MLTILIKEGITVENCKKRQWWAYAILFCLCGLSLIAQRVGGGPMIPPDTIYGIWYLYILPVLGAVVLTIAGKKRGKYDFLLLLAFEIFLLAWFILPEVSGLSITFNLSAWLFYGLILSLPAIAAFLLSGIAYIVIRNK